MATKRKPTTRKSPKAASRPAPFTLSDSEVSEYCQRWKNAKNTPPRLLILRALIREAWDLVCYMTDAGLQLRSSSPEQAALTIAGCAFAGWRYGQPDNEHLQAEAEVEIVRGFTTGILWAMWQGDGMPSELAETYTWFAERGDSALDRMIPLQVVEKLFPDMVKDGKLTLERVKVAPVNPDAWDAGGWTHRPNILTATFEEVKAAERAAAVRAKRHAAKRKPRAK